MKAAGNRGLFSWKYGNGASGTDIYIDRSVQIKTMARTIVLLLLMGVGVSNSLAQAAAKVDNNIYVAALAACVTEQVEQYGKLGSDEDFYNVNVESDTFTTMLEQTQFGRIKVEYLVPLELRDRYKKTGKPISLLAVRPMQVKDDRLEINVGKYWFTYEKKKNTYIYSLEGGCVVPVTYDCEKKQYVVGKGRLWGV